MTFLQFLVDTMCANFTKESMYDLIKTLLAEGPCTIADIARKIEGKDRSLDPKSAQVLGQAAIEALDQSGDIVIQGAYIHLAGRPSRS